MVKVTHHGSKGNNSDTLYSLIKSENYLFSVNGENKHNLPSKECIARILRNKKRPINFKYKFQFTYDNETLRSIFNGENEDIFNKYNFEVLYNKKSLSNSTYEEIIFIIHHPTLKFQNLILFKVISRIT